MAETSLKTSPRHQWKREISWVMGLVGLRVAGLIIFGLATQWREISDDIGFQLALVEHPLSLFLGLDATADGSYRPPFPPLLPFLLALIAKPMLLIASPMVSMRLTFIVYEAAAFMFTRLALQRGHVDRRTTRTVSIVWMLAPIGMMTSTIMCQEEVVGAMFVAAVCWLVVSDRIRAALVICGLGVVAGKIYLLVPLAGLIFCGPVHPREWARRTALGFSLIALAYAVAAVSWIRAGQFPLAGFTPGVEPSINIWGLVPIINDVDDHLLRRISAIPALGFGMIPVLVARLQASRQGVEQITGIPLISVMAAQLLCVFATFYLISPEYMLIATPAILIALHLRISIPVVVGLFSIPWCTNVAYGVRIALEHEADQAGAVSSGKAVFINAWNALSPISPVAGQISATIIFQLGLMALAAWMIWKLARANFSAAHSFEQTQ